MLDFTALQMSNAPVKSRPREGVRAALGPNVILPGSSTKAYVIKIRYDDKLTCSCYARLIVRVALYVRKCHMRHIKRKKNNGKNNKTEVCVLGQLVYINILLGGMSKQGNNNVNYLLRNKSVS